MKYFLIFILTLVICNSNNLQSDPIIERSEDPDDWRIAKILGVQYNIIEEKIYVIINTPDNFDIDIKSNIQTVRKEARSYIDFIIFHKPKNFIDPSDFENIKDHNKNICVIDIKKLPLILKSHDKIKGVKIVGFHFKSNEILSLKFDFAKSYSADVE